MGTKGKCNICTKTYTKQGLTRHVKNCIIELARYNKGKNIKERDLFLLDISSIDNPDYYMNILIDQQATLEMLDDFLRGIWVECCGHLSSFLIEFLEFIHDFDEHSDEYDEDDLTCGMKYSLEQVIDCGDEFYYSYDFGSTTELKLSVKEAYMDMPMEDAITVISRNLAPSNDLNNSPRNGVCAYTSDTSFDVKSLKVENYISKDFSEDAWDLPEMDEENVFPGYLSDTKGIKGMQDFIENISDFNEDDHIELNSLLLNAFQNLGDDLRNRDKQKAGRLYILEQTKKLKDCFSVFTKTDLNKLAKKLNMTKVSSLNKERLLEKVTLRIQETFEEHMAYLTFEQLDYIRRAAKYDGKISINRDVIDLFSGQAVMDFISGLYLFPVLGKNTLSENVSFTLPEELCQIIKKLNMNSYDRKAKHNSELMNLVRGYTYYYGVVSYEQLCTWMNNILKDTLQIDQLVKLVDKATLTDYSFYTWENMVVNGGIDHPMELVEELQKQDMNNSYIDYKPLSKKDLTKVKNKDYYVYTPEVSFFEEFIKDSYDVPENILYTFILSMMDYMDHMDSIEDIYKFTEEFIEIPNSNVKREIRNLINSIYNTKRQWVLKGYSLDEMDKIHKQVTKVTTVDFVKKVKVNRNDPCPCGSNRKYKHCCGR